MHAALAGLTNAIKVNVSGRLERLRAAGLIITAQLDQKSDETPPIVVYTSLRSVCDLCAGLHTEPSPGLQPYM